MQKKTAPTKGLENRLLGFERRFSHFEDSLRDNRMETIRLSNSIYKIDETLVKIEDHIERAEERLAELIENKTNKIESKIDSVVRVINDHHLKTLDRLDDLEKIHPKFSHTAI